MRVPALVLTLLAAALVLPAEDIKDRKKGPSHENKQFSYRITAPNTGWTKASAKAVPLADCMFTSGPGIALMVIAIETPEMDGKQMAEAVRLGMKSTGAEFKEVSTTPCRLAGVEAVRLVTDASVQKFKFTYVHYVVWRQGVLYQIAAWAAPATMTRELAQVDAFARSFRFLGPRKEWLEAHKPRAWMCEGNGLSASLAVDATWVASPEEDGSKGDLFLTEPETAVHLYINIADSALAPQAFRDEAEGRMRGWLQGYSTISRGKGSLAGVETWTAEGRGKLDNADTHVVMATWRDGGQGVLVVGAWPEAIGATGRRTVETALATIQVARETGITLPVPGSKRKKTKTEEARTARMTRGLDKAEVVLQMPPQSRLNTFAPSPDGKTLAVSIDGMLHLASVPDGEPRPASAAAAVEAIAWSADGKRLWFATQGQEVWTSDASGARARKLPMSGIAAAPGPDGRLLVVQAERIPGPLLDWWWSTGAQRLVSMREDGSDPVTLAETRLMALTSPSWHAGRRATLFLDGDAGAWRSFHGSLRVLGDDGKDAAKGAAEEATLSSAAWLPASGRVLAAVGVRAVGGGRAVVLDLETLTRTPLALENPDGGLAADATDRVYFVSWWRPDGEVGTTIYRREAKALVEDAKMGGVPVPLDDAALDALDAALESLLPDGPGGTRVTDEQLARAADEVAKGLGPHVVGGLDFRPESSAALAELLSGATARFASHPRATLGIGAYAAEVLRRHAGAEWAIGEGGVDFGDLDAVESPVLAVRNPLAEVWRIVSMPDEAWFSLSPEEVTEWCDGRPLRLTCSSTAGEAATKKAEGRDLVEAHAAWARFDAARSIEAYGRAIQAHPSSGKVRQEAASRAYAAGRLDLAATWAEGWASLEPDDPAAWTFRGSLAILSEPKRSIEWLSKAIELGEEASAPALFLRLGHAHLAAGDPKAARACFRKASEQAYGVGPEARRMLEEIKEKR